MSEEDFEAEARRRGWVKTKGESSEATSRGCFGDCFGGGKKQEAPALETVYEESDQNFEFRPHTQYQFEEPENLQSVDNTPLTPLSVRSLGSTPPLTPLYPQSLGSTPPLTPPYPQSLGNTPPLTPPSARALYYDVDLYGGVISDAKGKRVISRMRELMGIYFPSDVLTDWRRQPDDSKQTVLEALHREFPNPMDYRFRNEVMLSAMNQALKSRRGSARTAERHGDRKPPGLSPEDWRRVSDERRTFPNRWDQQREANRVQQSTTGISRFGSGGKANFLYKFEELVGRKPTKDEYEEGKSNNLSRLIARMRRDGIPFHPKPTSEMGPRPQGYEEDVEIANEDEDSDYVPSTVNVSDDETSMDTEADASLWLEDVDQPSTLRRFRGHR